MESFIISAALISVILLLSVAVYDTNTTLQRFVGRLIKSNKNEANSSQEMESKMEVKMDMEEEPQYQETQVIQAPESTINLSEIPQEHDKNEINIKKEVVVILRTMSDRIAGKVQSILGSRKKNAEDQKDLVMETLRELRHAVDDLSNRLSQDESATEDFKDSIWALRRSVDSLETQMEQADSSQLQDETDNRIRRMEESMVNIQASVESLPQQIENTQKDITEVNERLDNVSNDLQSTIGYGIHKTFECGSCGSEGFVASHVICSKCGTESMWGWWPPQDDPAQAQEINEEKDEVEQASELMGIDLQHDPAAEANESDTIFSPGS